MSCERVKQRIYVLQIAVSRVWQAEKLRKWRSSMTCCLCWILGEKILFCSVPTYTTAVAFNEVVGGLGFLWTEGYRRFVRAHDWPCVCVCKHSAIAGVWLMAERVQDAPWLLQIGTAETWQQKCSKLHTRGTYTYRTYTHFFFLFFPLNTEPQAEHPRMGGCRLHTLHILSVLEPAKCHF